MQRGHLSYGLLLAIGAALMASGCASSSSSKEKEAQQAAAEEALEQQDDSACRQKGISPGSQAYLDCRTALAKSHNVNKERDAERVMSFSQTIGQGTEAQK